MLDLENAPLFIAAALSLLLIPGPAVLYIVTRSIHQGRKAGLVSMLGIHLGTFFHIGAAALGLSAILLTSAVAFSLIKYLGAAYLIFLGITALRAKNNGIDENRVTRASLRSIFSQGVIVNALNPKTALFFFAFLPQFVDPARGSASVQFFTLGCIFVGLGVITDGAYAMLAGTFGELLRNSSRFLNIQRVFAGLVYIGLGVTTAFTGSTSTK